MFANRVPCFWQSFIEKRVYFCNWAVSFLPSPQSLPLQLVMMLLSTVFIAFGIFFYLPTNIMPLAGEGAVKAGSDVSGIAFPKVKAGFDLSMVTLSLAACLLCIHSPGSVGIGTVPAAVPAGAELGFLNRALGTRRDAWLSSAGAGRPL